MRSRSHQVVAPRRSYFQAAGVAIHSLRRGRMILMVLSIFRYWKALLALGAVEAIANFIPVVNVPDFVIEYAEGVLASSTGSLLVATLLTILVVIHRFRDPVAYPDPRLRP